MGGSVVALLATRHPTAGGQWVFRTGVPLSRPVEQGCREAYGTVNALVLGSMGTRSELCNGQVEFPVYGEGLSAT